MTAGNTSWCGRCLAPRPLFAWMALASLGLILFALYLQYQLGEHPCPLCISQRVFVIAVGVLSLGACLHGRARRVWATLVGLMALVGSGVAARHVWIQHMPADQVPSCGPGLEYMFRNFPLQRALELLFRGDGNCRDIGWTFLSFSIPQWTLVAFAGFLLLAVWQGLRRD